MAERAGVEADGGAPSQVPRGAAAHTPMETAGDRGVSFRSLALGLCLALGVGLMSNSARYLVHGSLTTYCHMPMGNLILVLLSIGICAPLAYGFGRSFVFSRAEWLTVFALGFVGALGPTYGISGQLVSALVSPYYFATPENRWSEFLHPYLADWLFPTNKYGGMSWFYNGVPAGASIPWEIWLGPLFWWFSFIASAGLACYCASIIIHRQWSEYEKLVFPAMEPIVEMAGSAGSGGRPLPEFMRGRVFWAGFALAAGIYGWNILGWFSPSLPQFRMTPGLNVPIARDFPALYVSVNTFALCFAYYASLEVLFSLWFFDLAFIFEAGVLTRLGLPSWHSYRSAGAYTWQSTGAFVCLALWWLLISRRHLRDALLKAIRPRSTHVDDGREMLSYRGAFVGLAIGCAFSAAWLWNAGMDAVVVLLIIPTMFLVYFTVGKIMADSGLVFLSCPTTARILTQAVLGGAKAVPAASHALFYSTSVAHSHFKGTVFTFGMHANRLGDFITRHKRRLFWGICTAFLIGVVTSTLFVIWLGYEIGGYNFEPNWLITRSGESGLQGAVTDIISPKPMETNEYVFFGLGAALMALLVLMRYRFARWPFHPIGFALSGSALSHLTAFTIFTAWAIKYLLLQFAGPAFYRKSRPFFVGLLAGYVVVIAVGLVVDTIWFMPRGHMVHRY